MINLSDDEIRIYEPSDVFRPRRYAGAAVSGPYRECFLIDPLQHASIIGVHFRPGRAAPVLGVPASELVDTHVDLEALWGPTAAELRERLCTAATPAQRFSLLEKTLARTPATEHGRAQCSSFALDVFEQAAGTS